MWHELFRKCVGNHTDYSEGTRTSGGVHPREQWPEFDEAYQRRVPRNLSPNEVIGWFEM